MSNVILVSFAGSVFSVTVSEGIDCFFSQLFQSGSGAFAERFKQSVNFDLSFKKSFQGDVQLSRKQGESGPPLAHRIET